jgi:hypothetical protein
MDRAERWGDALFDIGFGTARRSRDGRVFVCADTLTMSMPCRVHSVTVDGEQCFTVLKPEAELMVLLGRLLA